MHSSFHKSLLQEETRYKDDVYRYLDEEIQEAKENVAEKSAAVHRGAFEAQDAFVPHRELGGAYKNLNKKNLLARSLYPKPYFAHLELKLSDSKETEHYFLSDVPSLEQTLIVGLDEFLVPFKKDAKIPMREQLFQCYQAKNGKRQVFRPQPKKMSSK